MAHHFADRRALFTAVAVRGFDNLHTEHVRALEQLPDDAPLGEAVRVRGKGGRERIVPVLAVARAGQILSAARFLGLNQATLSRRIAGLERDLGAKLLVRRTHGSELTDAGAALVERDQPAKEVGEGGPFARLDRLELPFIGISGVERDPQEDEARIVIRSAGFGAADPADGAMHAQAHGWREALANGALLGLQFGMGDARFRGHSASFLLL